MLSAMGKVNDLIHLLGVSYPIYALSRLRWDFRDCCVYDANYSADRFAVSFLRLLVEGVGGTEKALAAPVRA